MILRGWKEITKTLGGMSENTARRLIEENGLPITILGGKPMTTQSDLEEWVSRMCQENSCRLKAHAASAGLIRAQKPLVGLN